MRRRILTELAVWGGFLIGLTITGLALPYEVGFDAGTVDGFSWRHPLGPDPGGRDLLYRLLIATRAFLLPSIVGALLATSFGVVVGALSGYVPGESDRTRFGDAVRWGLSFMLAVPGTLPRFTSILCLLVATSVWAGDIVVRYPWLQSYAFEAYLIGAATGLLYGAEIGNEIRSRVRQCCTEEFVESARADGLSLTRVLGFHIIYLQCRPLIYRFFFEVFAAVVLVESTLSYLQGFGVQEPQPSLGNILIMTKDRYWHGEWLVAIVPTVVIIGTFILLTRVGDLLSRLPRKGTQGL